MNTTDFSIGDIWNLRIACSEMRERWSNYYMEAIECKSDTVTTAKNIYEEYSDLYYKLVKLTNQTN